MFIFQILNEKKVNMQVAQSCPTLCDPMDYTVHGILQARILEWVAFPFYRGSSQPRDQIQVSCIAGRFFSSWATYDKVVSNALGTFYVLLEVFDNADLLHFSPCLHNKRNVKKPFKESQNILIYTFPVPESMGSDFFHLNNKWPSRNS